MNETAVLVFVTTAVFLAGLLAGVLWGTFMERGRSRLPRLPRTVEQAIGQLADAVGQPESFETRISREVTQIAGRTDAVKDGLNVLAGHFGLEFQSTKPEKSKLILVEKQRDPSDGSSPAPAPPRGAYS